MNQSLRFATFQGRAIEQVFLPLAQLRIEVFRAFPYLYEGSLEYEQAYLKTYANAERALLFAAYSGEQMVGATTCIPLADETPAVQKPFQEAGYDLAKVFYFGESILLPAFRGNGLGHRFFDEREAHARSFGSFACTCFCAVNRPADHPARPIGYQPLDAFWAKRGYQKVPELQSWFDWPDIGAAESTAKPMTYWLKPLL